MEGGASLVLNLGHDGFLTISRTSGRPRRGDIDFGFCADEVEAALGAPACAPPAELIAAVTPQGEQGDRCPSGGVREPLLLSQPCD
mmetsp:Transcript_39922/g.98856  ORF Transcript_39922/g.98856 Transcript_39922/m.98856 type:complete len:86 (+) Transcript_39922:192-449(+)